MKQLNIYISEKLRIDKNTELVNNIDEINNKFISDIKNHIIEKYPIIKFDSYEDYINVGKSKKYIFLGLKKQFRWVYKNIGKWINDNLDVIKPCKTNNMILYIYPKYE